MTSQHPDRDARMAAEYAAGDTLQAIGDRYGVTRERVRQIVVPRTGIKRQKEVMAANAEVAKKIALANLSRDEAVEAFGKKVIHITQKHAVKFRKAKPVFETAEMAEMAELVKGGMSIYAASGKNRRNWQRLTRYCAAHKIKSQARSRWSDTSQRANIIDVVSKAGGTWAMALSAVNEIEGGSIGGTALYQWAYQHMNPFHKMARRKGLPPNPPKVKPESQRFPVKKIKAKPTVIYCGNDAKKAAKLNYRKAPASLIAAVHGVSRNSIIGHWFRLRQNGELE